MEFHGTLLSDRLTRWGESRADWGPHAEIRRYGAASVPGWALLLPIRHDAARAGVRCGKAGRGAQSAVGVFGLDPEATGGHLVEVVPGALVVGLVALGVIPGVGSEVAGIGDGL